MKNFLLSFSLLLVVSCIVGQEHSKVYDQLTYDSKILGMKRKYAVYLPADYATSEREYPVLYLLHGASDNQAGWIQYGEIKHIADEAIKNGTATAMIIVMPDADTGVMGYFNAANGKWNYEDHFFEEFMPYIDATYRTKKTKRFRAIAGLSMGGGGSFVYALNKPELFSSACPLSAYAGPLTIAELKDRWFTLPMVKESTEVQLGEYYSKYAVVDLVKKATDQNLKSIRWYIDCGDDDYLFEGNSLIHIELKKRNIPHEFRIRDGAHNWTYWRTAMPNVLSFVSDGFRLK